jgi:hypothetical protein
MPTSPFGTTGDSDQNSDPGGSRHRHKRKRKHSHRNRIPREVIIGLLLVLACLAAYGVWYFLVQDTPRRTAAPSPEPQSCIKA